MAIDVTNKMPRYPREDRAMSLYVSIPIEFYTASRCFSATARLLCAPDPTLFHPNFGVFPLHEIAHVGVSKRIDLQLFGREIIFEVYQPV